jgi:hypothetical protein
MASVSECGWRIGLCAGCESCAAHPVSPGAPMGYVEPPRLRRLKWRATAAVWAVRRRVGFWIAGESPDE